MFIIGSIVSLYCLHCHHNFFGSEKVKMLSVSCESRCLAYSCLIAHTNFSKFNYVYLTDRFDGGKLNLYFLEHCRSIIVPLFHEKKTTYCIDMLSVS